jgi:hypothetical protein
MENGTADMKNGLLLFLARVVIGGVVLNKSRRPSLTFAFLFSSS